MTRLPVVRPTVVVSVLERLGFEKIRQKGSHVILRHPESGRMTIVAMHGRDLPKATLQAILKQAGITAKQLQELL